MDFLEIGRSFAIYFIPFLFALCFHEFAHGWVAKLKGDRTAEMMGRLTLNPIAHMDPIGTLLLPLAAIITHIPFFGWAKPVPVNSRNLKNPRNDMFWIALAGPLSNVFLAIMGAVAITLVLIIRPGEITSALLTILVAFVQINLFLGFFNLIPLHPLDGGKVLARFIPYRWNEALERNQGYLNIALLLLFVTGGFQILAQPAVFSAHFLVNSAEYLATSVAG
jgi:Zn-dependent protease